METLEEFCRQVNAAAPEFVILGAGALIVADHMPFDKEQLAAEESALQLSGHTHAGQVWPLRGVYRMLGLPAYGEYAEPHTRLYVSAGESGWTPTLRTEVHCEWELITLLPPETLR